MSYTPTTWQTGDTITAEKLNNMESGIENANEPFIVTCTPTSQNYSGVMDKTVAEINEAYEAGRKIYFRVLTGANTYAEVLCAIAVKDTALYPSYGGYTIDLNNNLFIYAYTGYTNDGTMNAYGAAVFPLTPMS